MSKNELGRVEVLARVKSKQLRVVDAAPLLRVSYRQAKRLGKLYREEGAAGLKHRSAGRPSHRAYEAKFRRKVLRLVREKYSGAVGERFGPTLTTEHLESEDAHPSYICVLHAQTPFLFSKVFALCRSENRIRAISIKNGLGCGRLKFWPTTGLKIPRRSALHAKRFQQALCRQWVFRRNGYLAPHLVEHFLRDPTPQSVIQ